MVLHLLYCHFGSQRNCSRQIRPRSTLSDHVSSVITALTFIAIQDSVQGCNVSRRTTFSIIGVRHKSSSYSEKRTDNNLPSIIADVVRNAITEFSACGLYTSGNRSPNTTVSSTLKTATQWRFQEKIFGGPGPSSFGRQQRLSEITTDPINSTIAKLLCPIV